MFTPKLSSVSFRPKVFLSGAAGPWAGHLPFACDLVTALRPELIVELGVFYGDSYFGFCQAASENLVQCSCYGIDTWRGDAHGGFYGNAVFEAVSRYNEATYSSSSYLLRSTFDHAVTRFSDESIGLLHIDGFHTYDAVRHDFATWYPKVRPGGIILLHDTTVRLSDFGVWKLWEELEQQFESFMFRNSNGLGVLRKPGALKHDAFLTELFSSSPEDQEWIRRYYTLCADRLQLSFKTNISLAVESGHTILQFFSQHGAEYREIDGNTQIIETGKWLNIITKLPFDLENGALRIDPANRPAIVDLTRLTLRTTNGDIIWLWNAEHDSDEIRVDGTAFRLPAQDSFRICSYGNDPQLYLPKFDQSATGQLIEVELRILVDLNFETLQAAAKRFSKAEQQQQEREQALTLHFEQERQLQIETAAKRELILQQQYDTTRQQLDLVRQLQFSIISDRERVYETNAKLSQDSALAVQQIGDLKSEIDHMNTNCDNCKLELTRSKEALADLRRQFEIEKKIRSQLEHSRSWRLTKPLRAVIGLFRNLT